ncbi:copper chaperone PCu(A)C [Gordonia sp. X0973]|uniref:copper chaperone PCu(A)C n=1 Tax=Gordonia sp. X0973 TaxID=2742602 RepID=UPI000F548338|nr:copper chaperone PCu(A)C [Gordonia sp. X0973]QKT07317.1 copper chaperone PCu(A)C [Gordonia sp. X0973]
MSTTSVAQPISAGRRPGRLVAAVITSVTAAALLAGCGSSDKTAPASDLHITDPWVKAAPSGMTAAFATIANDGGSSAHIVSAESPAAMRMEIHEVVTSQSGESMMQQKKDGLVIPAHGSVTLKPGGDHLMLFNLVNAITPGKDVKIQLKLSDGSKTTFTAQVRDFPGADENYHR